MLSIIRSKGLRSWCTKVQGWIGKWETIFYLELILAVFVLGWLFNNMFFVFGLILFITWCCRLIAKCVFGYIIEKGVWNYYYFYILPIIMPVADIISLAVSYLILNFFGRAAMWTDDNADNDKMNEFMDVVFRRCMILKAALIFANHILLRKVKFIEDIVGLLKIAETWVQFEEDLCNTFGLVHTMIPDLKTYLLLEPCMSEMKCNFDISESDWVYAKRLMYESRFSNYTIAAEKKESESSYFSRFSVETNVAGSNLRRVNQKDACDFMIGLIDDCVSKNREFYKNAAKTEDKLTKYERFAHTLVHTSKNDIKNIVVGYFEDGIKFRSLFIDHAKELRESKLFFSFVISVVYFTSQMQSLSAWIATAMVLGQSILMIIATYMVDCLDQRRLNTYDKKDK